MALAKHMEELAEKTIQNLAGYSGQKRSYVDLSGFVHYETSTQSDDREDADYWSTNYRFPLYVPRRR